MNAERARQIRRRWLLPIYLVLLLIWVVSWGLTLTVGGGIDTPRDAMLMVVTGLVVGIGVLGEWLYRRGDRTSP